MRLPGIEQRSAPDAQGWRAQAIVRAAPEDVLAALTDPLRIADWAPVSFELEDGGCGRLRCGTRQRVSGSVAGLRASFEVEVIRAEPDAFELVAEGPVAMDVVYTLHQRDGRVAVEARVALRRSRGLGGQLLRGAVVALLNAGALDRALQRLADSLCERTPAEPLAA